MGEQAGNFFQIKLSGVERLLSSQATTLEGLTPPPGCWNGDYKALSSCTYFAFPVFVVGWVVGRLGCWLFCSLGGMFVGLFVG